MYVYFFFQRKSQSALGAYSILGKRSHQHFDLSRSIWTELMFSSLLRTGDTNQMLEKIADSENRFLQKMYRDSLEKEK